MFYERTRIVVRNDWPRYLYTVMINLTQVKSLKTKKLKNDTRYYEIFFEGDEDEDFNGIEKGDFVEVVLSVNGGKQCELMVLKKLG